jgi:hypothetical protein
MSTLSWMSRVRAWFATRHAEPAPAAPTAAWAGGTGTLALVGTTVADGPAPAAGYAPAGASPRLAAEPPPRPAPPRRDKGNGNGRRTPRIDPLDPPWTDHLEALDGLAGELQGHRETGAALLHAVRQLPELTSDQTDHIVQTNRLLQQQNTLLGSVLDNLAALRSTIQTMEESSRRNLTAIGQLEASHREILWGYQEMLQRSHRRLGRLAAAAAVLAALALGGAAYVAYVVLVAG